MPWPSHRSIDGGIDRIPLPDSPGELWLCGKHVTGPDAEAAMARVGATTIVCLNERTSWRSATRTTWRGWWPTAATGRCGSHPRPPRPPVETVVPFLDDLHRRLDAGERVLMHCGAGIGRAGTMAAGVLMTMGVPPRRTGHRGRAPADGGPEAGTQRELIDALAAR
jgi:hypothetical protein